MDAAVLGVIGILGADGDNATGVRLGNVKAGNLNIVTAGTARVQWQCVEADASIVRFIDIGRGGVVDGTGIIRSRGDINNSIGDLADGCFDRCCDGARGSA